MVCWVAVVGCSPRETLIDGGDSETLRDSGSTSAEAPCGNRGQDLVGLVVTSESDGGGELTMSFVEGEPAVPVVGNNSWLFRLEVDGRALSDVAADITVTPFMPDHGHGTPTLVRISEEEKGNYRFEPVHTRMAGYWEIFVDIETESIATKLSFGVCVE